MLRVWARAVAGEERGGGERQRREGAPHGSASVVTTCALPRSSSR